MPNLNDPNRYIDLAKFLEKQTNYMDYEGMASTLGIVERAEWAAEITIPRTLTENSNNPNLAEQRSILKTLITHVIYENRDQADNELTDEQLIDFAYAINMVIECRWVMKEE
jgi:hypothetical protein